jgi:hypothetical protein
MTSHAHATDFAPSAERRTAAVTDMHSIWERPPLSAENSSGCADLRLWPRRVARGSDAARIGAWPVSTGSSA